MEGVSSSGSAAAVVFGDGRESPAKELFEGGLGFTYVVFVTRERGMGLGGGDCGYDCAEREGFYDFHVHIVVVQTNWPGC